MKKFIVIFLLLGFLFPSFPISAQEATKTTNKSETVEKQKNKRLKKNDLSEKQVKESNSVLQTKEQRKKDIEAKELTVDKNKKVKMTVADENLPQTIKKRNIP